MIKKLVIFIIILLYQTNLFSKSTSEKIFNQRYLSNYFSALISFENMEYDQALRFYNSSKNLISIHDNFLKNYLYSLIEEQNFKKAIREIENSSSKIDVNFFEAKIVLLTHSLINDNLLEAKKYAKELQEFKNNGTFELIISETLESYINVFLYKKPFRTNNDFGTLNLVSQAFQECYLNEYKSSRKFITLINSEEGDYSRYLFFYLRNLINNGDLDTAKQISTNINPLDSNLLISQSKFWIEENKFNKFTEVFSCQNPKHIISEFLFLISNLYSSQNEFKKSNFYFKISNYLNPKFYFNFSLLAENYILQDNYKLSKKALKTFSQEDTIYNWYKIKKIAQIISIEDSQEVSMKYIEKNLDKMKMLNYKILYDVANIYKNFEKYKKSIKFYNIVLDKIDSNSISYSDTLYRRGSSYERLGDHKNSDRDLIKSLEINPNDPFVLNYLAYSWLERNYKVKDAIDMLKKAYDLKKNNPYIIDSLGWAFYLNSDYINAEKYIRQAIEIRPTDPVIMDHYGDILWMLGHKLQARYYWKNVLKSEENTEVDKKTLQIKLIKGLINN